MECYHINIRLWFCIHIRAQISAQRASHVYAASSYGVHLPFNDGAWPGQSLQIW